MKSGKFIKWKRTAKGWSIRELARRSGLSNVYAAHLEKGLYNPTLAVVDRLLKALDVSWLEFLTATGYVKAVKKPCLEAPPRRKAG